KNRIKFFNIAVKGKFFFKTLFNGKFLYEALQGDSSRVGDRINSVTHTIDKSGTVESLFVEKLLEIYVDFLFVCPVFNLSLHLFKHAHNLKVCTAVLRSFK